MKFIKKLTVSILIISLITTMIPSFAFAGAVMDDGNFVTFDYSDVQSGWYEKWAGLYGYNDVFESGDDCFYPYRAVTRMEFVRLLHRALDININYFDYGPADISDYFDDVESDGTGAGDLYDLVTCGIVDTTGSFDPDGQLDRDEMIHYIMNAFYYFAGSDYAIPDLTFSPFEDDSNIKAEYGTDVKRSVILGLITGRGEHLLYPRDGATRAEAVTAAGRLAAFPQEYKSNVVIKASAEEEDGVLRLSLSVLNNTEKTVTINHNSGKMFDFMILNKGGDIMYRWSDGMAFTMMITTTEIDPGDDIVFSDVLNASAYSAIRDEAAYVKAYIVGTSPDFTVNADGYYVADTPFSA
ncbi:MAG: BsuPI-related putative proteinase inhibitor [Oscillospiraceae bacterium]